MTRCNFETPVHCVGLASGRVLHQRKVVGSLRLRDFGRHLCLLFGFHPPLFGVPVAPSDMPEQLRRPMASVCVCYTSGDDVVLTKGFGVSLPRVALQAQVLQPVDLLEQAIENRERTPAACEG